MHEPSLLGEETDGREFHERQKYLDELKSMKIQHKREGVESGNTFKPKIYRSKSPVFKQQTVRAKSALSKILNKDPIVKTDKSKAKPQTRVKNPVERHTHKILDMDQIN